MRTKKNGFTLMEVMIVVLMIAILLAIAVPNMFQARETARTKTCIGNLWHLQQAKDEFAMARGSGSGSMVQTSNIVPDYLIALPECPSGGTYALNSVDSNATCSTGGKHALAPL